MRARSPGPRGLWDASSHPHTLSIPSILPAGERSPQSTSPYDVPVCQRETESLKVNIFNNFLSFPLRTPAPFPSTALCAASQRRGPHTHTQQRRAVTLWKRCLRRQKCVVSEPWPRPSLTMCSYRQKNTSACESNTRCVFMSVYQDLLVLSKWSCGMGGARVLAPVLERAVFIMCSREEEMEQ